jgi:hypothetical protein
MNFEALSSNPITAKKNKVACFLGQAGYGVTPSPFTADSTFYPVPHARAYTRRAMTMFSSSLKGVGEKPGTRMTIIQTTTQNRTHWGKLGESESWPQSINPQSQFSGHSCVP